MLLILAARRLQQDQPRQHTNILLPINNRINKIKSLTDLTTLETLLLGSS